ncbi:MAG: hypothetical protein ACSHYB_18635 [Roseibacillus sp.]
MARGRTTRTSKKRIDLKAPRKRSKKARKTPLSRRPTLREAFRTADQVARARSNRRVAGRKGLRTIQASLDIPLPEIGTIDFDEPEEHALSLPDRVIRFIIGLLLFIPCAVTTITLFQRVSETQENSETPFISEFWHTSEFFYFAIGCGICATWLLSGVLRKIWLYLYVLGHELTHVLFIYLSFGKVSGFSVGLDGGYVVTNKSNVLIALSPYFVPFWSLVALLILAPLNHFLPLIPGFPESLLSYDQSSLTPETPDLLYYNEVLFAVIGATWLFHLLFTCWMIPRDQPDLKENETFFSLMLIILANIVLLSGLLCFASPDLGWRDFVYNWYNNFLDLFWEPISVRFLD